MLGSGELKLKLLAISLGEVWGLHVKVMSSFSVVNSFDRLPQLSAVGDLVYGLNECSPLSSFVIRCRFGDLIIHCRQPGQGGILLA